MAVFINRVSPPSQPVQTEFAVYVDSASSYACLRYSALLDYRGKLPLNLYVLLVRVLLQRLNLVRGETALLIAVPI